MSENETAGIVDRIEGGFAVLEEPGTLKTFNVPLAALPIGVKDGDAIEKDAAGNYVVNEVKTRERKARARALLDRLKRKV